MAEKRAREEETAAPDLREVAGTAMDVENAKKEAASKPSGPDAKRRMIAATPEVIKRQIEYYLSDKNLSQDHFFWNSINDNKMAGSYLPMEKIFACNKIKMMKRADGSGMGITTEDVKEAIANSDFVEFGKSDNMEAVEGIRRKDPTGKGALPKLEAGPKIAKGVEESKEAKGKANEAKFHAMGVVFMVADVPETHGWTDVKKTLKDKLFADAQSGKMASKSYIDFCSTKTAEGEVFMSASSFAGDLKYFEEDMEKTKVDFYKFSPEKAEKLYPEGTADRELKLRGKQAGPEGKEVDLALTTENADLWQGTVKIVRCDHVLGKDADGLNVTSMAKAMELMPQFVKEKRIRNQKKSKQAQNVAITVANVRIGSMMELKKKVREIQGNYGNYEEIRKNGTDYNLIRELMVKWHPTGEAKLKGELGIMVGPSKYQGTRCFYVILERDAAGKPKGNGETDGEGKQPIPDQWHTDFSMTKIYQAMEAGGAFQRPS